MYQSTNADQPINYKAAAELVYVYTSAHIWIHIDTVDAYTIRSI